MSTDSKTNNVDAATASNNENKSQIGNSDSSETTKKKVTWGKSNKQASKQNSGQNQKKRFQGGTAGLEDHIFYYGTGMDTKFVTSKEHLLIYIAKKYSASEEVSLENGKPTLLGVTSPSKITDTEYNKLGVIEKERIKITLKRHVEASDLLLKNLTACYAIIWGQLTENLKNHLRRDSTFADIHAQRNSPELFALMGSICTRTVGIDHAASKVMDHLYSIMTLSGDKMGLSDFYKQFIAKMKGNATAGIDFASSKLKKDMLDAFKEKGGHSAISTEYQNYKIDIKDHCNQQVYALIFMKQAGERYEECRRDLKNDFYKGNDNIPVTVDEAFALLQQFVPSTRNNRNQTNKNGGNAKKSNSSSNNDEQESNAKGKHPAHSFQQSFS